MRIVNSLEIFNRYFHKLCNGKGLVSIYELTYSIKDKFSNSEIKLINDEKKISNFFSKSKNISLKKHLIKEDFEEALFKGFHNIFGNSNNDLHHIGCYFHYLQACRRKLQSLHFTSKKNINIYKDFMNKFGNFAFIKNISKKRILKELNNIEKNYNLNHDVSNYFKDTYELNIYYIIPKNIL